MEFEKKGDRGCRHNGGGSVWKNIEHLKCPCSYERKEDMISSFVLTILTTNKPTGVKL